MRKQYKRDFLSKVIIRIDFAIPLKTIEKELNPELSRIILKYFQIPEPRKLIGEKFQFSATAFQHTRENLVEWCYFDKNRVKQLILNPDFILIVYKEHEKFEKVKEEFTEILRILNNIEINLQVKRFGLRYINNIELGENDLTDWTKYINKNLLSIFNYYEKKEELSRIINHIEFNFDDLKFRFQSGMRNPDYPASIKRKFFDLDYDCYFEGLINNLHELELKITKAHEEIIEMFEKSITGNLRRIMNESQKK